MAFNREVAFFAALKQNEDVALYKPRHQFTQKNVEKNIFHGLCNIRFVYSFQSVLIHTAWRYVVF